MGCLKYLCQAILHNLRLSLSNILYILCCVSPVLYNILEIIPVRMWRNSVTLYIV